MKRIYLTAVLAIILSMTLALMTFTSCSRQPVYPSPPMEGANVVIDIAALQADAPKFYSYLYQGNKINFFVFKVRESVLAFLDACASCYPHKRGYHYEKGAVTCRNCDQKFAINKLDKGLGGCYPIRIEGRVEKGRYIIPVAVLEKEADKF
jgi:uncharacterized membrane protein